MNKLAQQLIAIQAVALKPNNPFTWSSGIKSPIYCDNRLTLSYPEVRNMIAERFVNIIEQHYSDVELIAGTATAGIPHAAWVSDKMNLPMCYVRSQKKGHGKGNQIEGVVKKGAKTIVIEDLISTGKSAIKAAKALQEAGAEVMGVVAIFTYELDKAAETFKEAHLDHYSLTNLSELIEAALAEGVISERDVESLMKWQANPEAAGWLAD